MSFTTERASIYAKFASIWNEVTLGKIAWENQPFVQPNKEIFVEIKILNLASNQMSIGNDKKLYRHLGEVQFDIYIPQNKGTHEGRTRADIIANAFRNIVLTTTDSNTIQFRVPILRQLAPNEIRALNMEDSLFRLIVRCPFYRDEII